MAMHKIDLQRIEMLIRGEQPESTHEELFVLSFKAGLDGESFMLTLMGISDIFEGLSHQDKDYFNLGYAIGQKTYLENTEETDFIYSDSSKKTTH